MAQWRLMHNRIVVGYEFAQHVEAVLRYGNLPSRSVKRATDSKRELAIVDRHQLVLFEVALLSMFCHKSFNRVANGPRVVGASTGGRAARWARG